MAALEKFFPPDPGWLRLLAAIRATLGGLLTFGLVMLLSHGLPLTVSDRVLGFALSLFIAASNRDAGRKRQATTMLLAPVPAIAAGTLAAVLADYTWLGAGAMVLVVFVAIYAASLGTRWGSLGMVGLIAYVISLVTHATPAHLPAACLVAVLAAADAALVRFVLLPERPGTEFVRLRRAVRRGAARVLDEIEPALRGGAWAGGARERLITGVQRVSEAAMMAQMRVGAAAATDGAAAAVSLRLVELELAIERVARIAATDLGDAVERPRLHALLIALRDALRADQMPSAGPAAERFQSRLGRVMVGLAHLLDTPLRPVAVLPSAPAAVAASSGLRPALQGSLAAGLAIVGGELISPNRWYWAAFAAFALFQGTRSRGESIAKAVQFMSGTLAGVVAGVLLATLLAGQMLASLVVLIVAVLLAFDAFVAAYGMMIFWVTIALGMLFGMLGYFAPEVLLLRLQETAVGAACGIAVACVVLARPTRDATLAAVEALLPAIGALVSRAAAALLAGAPDPAVLGLVLAAEQRFEDLRAASQPALHGLVALGHEAQRRRLLFLSVCVFWARELGDLSLAAAGTPQAAAAPTIRDAAARIAATAERLGREWRSVAADPPEGGDDVLASLPTGLDRSDPGHNAARLLLRIDAALSRLAPPVASMAAA
jgi:uncharacterized membrane protein YccC